MADESDESVLERRATQLAVAKTVAATATITARMIAGADATIPDLSTPGSIATPSHRADYEIVRLLGEGGMGRVHLARQRSLDREVALKTLQPGAPPAVANALVREARLTGALEHPGVIPVHSLGVDENGGPMLVMKRVDGVDLATLLASPQHAAWRARDPDRLVALLEILIQVCRTLELAHSHGIIHRDIKPENVMVGSFGEVYLVDWGIAVRPDEDTGSLVGTPSYMAPEMVRGATIDPRTDVYLLGATLHEILTGVPRHTGQTVMDVIRAAIASEPVAYPLTAPAELAALANRATARDPAARPASVVAFREALAEFLRRRTARALCVVGLARVEELEAILASTSGVPSDLPRAYRLATEGRFGLTESLREAADDAVARDAMRRCLVAAIELELRQDHADSADALLAELDVSAPQLVVRARAARDRVADRHRAGAKLASLEHDLDPTENARWRSWPLVGFGSAILALAAVGWRAGVVWTPNLLLLVMLPFSAALALTMFVLRRRIMRNVFNRRAAALVFLAALTTLASRALGALLHRAAVDTLVLELVILSAMVAAGAVTMFRGFWIPAAVFGAGAVVGALAPSVALAVFAATSFMGFVALAAVLRYARRAT
jgi:serine/threonine-protein kinase